ncbi:MAG: glycosyl hydrolase 53 family protein [Ignavibacteriales bacterium]|nr:glycosyl hydrolase 53 family protein [Ignavibacteriales bacterium]
MRKFFLAVIFFFSSLCFSQSGSEPFISGVDISFTPQIESLGGKYLSGGVQKDPLDIFKENGVNYVRLRIWHTPANGWCGLNETLKFAQRIKSRGLKFLLDFHYSDTWADPQHQNKPAAWANLPFENLKDSVYAYTKNIIAALKNQNTLPGMVQIGNEVTGGMLWHDGKLYGAGDENTQWKKFAQLINEGIRGVREAADTSQIKIMIHIDRGGDNGGAIYFYDKLKTQNVLFDVIGLSFYPWWHGTLTQLKNNLNSLAVRYQKEIVVVETAYPWTLQYKNDGVNNIVGLNSQLHQGYPASVDGQKNFLNDLKSIIKQTSGGKGTGFFYWEPAYISVSGLGSSWENLTVFNFNNEVLQSITAFNDSVSTEAGEDVSNMPEEFSLSQNYPNPFNPSTTIEYTIPSVETRYIPSLQHVTLKVYDVLGREIAALVNEYQIPGKYSVEFRTLNAELPTGIYFYKLTSGSLSRSKKMLLIK